MSGPTNRSMRGGWVALPSESLLSLSRLGVGCRARSWAPVGPARGDGCCMRFRLRAWIGGRDGFPEGVGCPAGGERGPGPGSGRAHTEGRGMGGAVSVGPAQTCEVVGTNMRGGAEGTVGWGRSQGWALLVPRWFRVAWGGEPWDGGRMEKIGSAPKIPIVPVAPTCSRTLEACSATSREW